MAGGEAIVSFLVPGLAVAAVVTASLPWLLHLLLRRPRVTAWPSTMLLQRALARLRRRRLDQWILLLCRSLALLAIGLGMAGPLARTMTGTASQELWIVIDDGATGAERLDGGGTVLSRLQEIACQAIDRLQPGEPVTVIAAGLPVTRVLEGTGDHDRARQVIRAMVARPVPTNLPAAIEQALPDASTLVSRQVQVLSGFREGALHQSRTLDPGWSERARRATWTLAVPRQDRVDDTAIVWASLDRALSAQGPDQSRRLRVRLTRHGSTPAMGESIQVRDTAGTVVATAQANWSEGSEAITVEVSLPASVHACMVARQGDAQPMNDAIAVIGDAAQAPRVLLVGRSAMDGALDRMSASDWVARALEASNLTVQRADPAALGMRPQGGVDVIVTCRPDQLDAGGWSWIANAMRHGSAMVLMPAGEDNAWWQAARRELEPGWSMQASSETGRFRLAPRQPRSELLALLSGELDAMGEAVRVQRRTLLTSESAQTILLFEDDQPAALMHVPGSGSGVLVQLAFAPELEWTDLPLKPLMVPLFQELVRSIRSIGAAGGVMETGVPAMLGSGAAGDTLVGPGSDGTVLSLGDRGETLEAVERVGLWTLRDARGGSRDLAARLEPAAASIESVSGEPLALWGATLGSVQWMGAPPPDAPGPDPEPSAWTWPLLAAGLALLLLESAWSRRVASRRGQPGLVEPA